MKMPTCPACGSDVEQTTVGYVNGLDMSKASCIRCGWKGRVRELVRTFRMCIEDPASMHPKEAFCGRQLDHTDRGDPCHAQRFLGIEHWLSNVRCPPRSRVVVGCPECVARICAVVTEAQAVETERAP